MKLKTTPKVLECLLAVNLDVNIWSARRKLSPDDFAHGDLPPEGLASLGSKRICDPSELKIFGTLKSRAVSLLSKSGVRFLGGWAIPEGKAPDIIHQLDIISKDFFKAKNDFISRYDQSVATWIKDNPGWESIIASSTVNAEYVAKRIDFNYQLFKVVNPSVSNGQEIRKGLNAEVAKLGNTLFDEIAKAAADTWKRSYLGKTTITRKALSPLKQLHNKLVDLTFIEPKVAPVAAMIESACTSLPKRGAITGNALLRLKGLVSVLSDTNSLLAYAQEIIDGRSNDNVLDSLMNQSVAPLKKPKTKTNKEPVTDKPKLVSLGLW